MSGIVFFKTKSLENIHHFYHKTLEMEVWLEQANCYIYKKGNLILGFLQSDQAETQGIITIFNQRKTEIDQYYKKYANLVTQDLKVNEKFNIYHFYICDPEGRKIEFQTFLHPLNAYHSLDEGLVKRRSIRNFKDKQVEKEVLDKIFSLCRYSPTARNSQSYYYLVIQDPKDLNWLANSRGPAGNPIKQAPMAVLVISDNTKTRRLEQDADIAATYFMLAAYSYDVASCWITDMNKDQVKSYFNIPQEYHISCAIATGYADEFKVIPERRSTHDFVYYDRYDSQD
jgi:nitroreductase